MPIPFFAGLERLGGVKLVSAATTTATLTIPAYDLLWVVCAITGYSGSDIARLRFNGVTTAANYTQRMGYLSTAASTTVATQADNGVTNGAILLGQNTTTTGRIAVVTINNHTASTIKPLIVTTVTASSSATTEINPLVLGSQGQFVAASATTQITSIVMMTPTSSMSTGSGFTVYGVNL